MQNIQNTLSVPVLKFETVLVFFARITVMEIPWEEFTPCDGDHMRNLEDLMGNLIGSKNLATGK